MHDRVADDRQLVDLVALDARAHRELGDEAVEGLADRRGHLPGALGMHHCVRDPAHEVLAEPDLGVHHPVAGEDGSVGQVGEVAGDRRGPDVDRDAVRLVMEPRPDPGHGVTLVDRDRHRERTLLERRLEVADDGQIRLEIGQAPFLLERLEQADEIARWRGQLRRDHLDVVEPDDGVDMEVADVEALADDLAVDLALRRDVDDGVAEDMGGAGESASLGQALVGAVLRLDGVERAQVLRPRFDPVLGERADALLDLAAAADPAPAADRVDVDAECARRVEDGRPLGEPAAPTGRGEDDERLGRRGHRAGLGLNRSVA